MEMKYALDLSSPFQRNWKLEIDIYHFGHDSVRIVLQSHGEPETLGPGSSLVTVKEVGCSALSLTFKQEDCRKEYSGTYRTQVRVNEINDEHRPPIQFIRKMCTIQTVLNVEEGSRSSQGALATTRGHEHQCKMIQNSQSMSVHEGGTMEMNYAVDLSSPFQRTWKLEIDIYHLGHDSVRIVLQSHGEPETLGPGSSLVTIKKVGCAALSLSFKQEDCRKEYSGTYRTVVRVVNVQVKQGGDMASFTILGQCEIETVLNVEEGSRSS
ncbi:uncharacterized protein [Ptychodera flava]